MAKVTVHHAPRTVTAEHGVVCALPDEFFGYFGWPSVARVGPRELVVVASGFRNTHVDPFGRTVLLRSYDDGRSWTTPQVVNDLPIDDRDAGIVDLGGGRLLVSWFTSDTRRYDVARTYRDLEDPVAVSRYAAGFRRLTDATVARWLGSWVRISEDSGASWSLPRRAPVTSPHGPLVLPDEAVLPDGRALLYLGKVFNHDRDRNIRAYRSEDLGQSWQPLGTVPLYPHTVADQYHEPHALRLPGGRLLGLIRIQEAAGAIPLAKAGVPTFSMMQATSDDGGRTWTTAQPLGFHGSPPHLMVHSTGVVVAVYGYRERPYGQRAMVSYDGGDTWDAGYILRADGPDGDLGYPASVELADGQVFTVYYQKRGVGEPCSLLWSRWALP